WRSCSRKIRYYSLEQANDKAMELNDQPDCWHWQEGYECEFCPYFHVGRTLRQHINKSFISDKNIEDLHLFYGVPLKVAASIESENTRHHHRRIKYIKGNIKTA